jgi:hypothetical protein
MGKQVKWSMGLAGAVVLPALLAVLAACASDTAPAQKLPATVTGKVIGASGPVAGAIVQVLGTSNRATTDANGVFRLHGEGLGSTSVTTITAWGPDHYINYIALDPQKRTWTEDAQQAATGVDLTLKPLFPGDNHEYGWFTFEGKEGSATCGMCHREYPEWQADAHSKSTTSHRFVTLYRGTNMQGQKTQPIQYSNDGKILPPDPALPDYGPGFRIDNPERPGNCATCHAPLARKIETTNSCAWSGCHTSLTAERASTQGYDLMGASASGLYGIAEEGISCEFCHVVQSVKFDPATGLPFPDQPGIMSMELRRPPADHKLFFGTFMDTTRDGLSYLPFQSTSEFCAACHHGVMGGVVSNMKVTGGVVVYNSYGEWKDSPWSDPQTGNTCQDCHMPTKNTPFSVRPEMGGMERPAGAYHDHTMTGPSSSLALMWNAVTMKSAATRDGDLLRVEVDITNDKTGHAVPTDAPIRSVMLIVEARDDQGNVLAMTEGATLPEWAGDQAGKPGKGFAKILRDTNTNEAPTAAYWRQVEIVEDTRLFPMKTDSSRYAFALPQGKPAKVTVKLIYRPAFQKLAQQKGWNDPDIVMQEVTLQP